MNFNKPIVDLEGKDLPDTNLGKMLAHELVNAQTDKPVKCYELAVRLMKNAPIELDTDDSALLKEFITTNKNFTNLVKAQLLLLFS